MLLKDIFDEVHPLDPNSYDRLIHTMDNVLNFGPSSEMLKLHGKFKTTFTTDQRQIVDGVVEEMGLSPVTVLH